MSRNIPTPGLIDSQRHLPSRTFDEVPIKLQEAHSRKPVMFYMPAAQRCGLWEVFRWQERGPPVGHIDPTPPDWPND
jgi:hypothetical protein